VEPTWLRSIDGINPREAVMTDHSLDSQPGFTTRAKDSVADAARTGADVAVAFAAIVNGIGDLIEDAKAPGKPLDRLGTLTRKAPLTCLGVAFLIGVVTTRRR
jgi:hypothetical protein